MKMKVFLDAINNGYARLVSEERAMEQMDVLRRICLEERIRIWRSIIVNTEKE